MATFRKKRSRKYKRRNTRRNRRSKKSLVGGAEEEFKLPKVQIITDPKDLIQAIKDIIYNRGSNEQYSEATKFISNMRINISWYTAQFIYTLNNNKTIVIAIDKTTVISSLKSYFKEVDGKLNQLLEKTISKGKLTLDEESSIIEEAREIGMLYYIDMLESLRKFYDEHYD
jgi:ribosomal protein S2